MRPVFVYGTLLDPGVLAAVSGRSGLWRARRPARAAGVRIARVRGTPYPTLVPHAGGMVTGFVIRPDPAALARLRAYEGRLYAFRPIRVLGGTGPIAARAWVTRDWMGAGNWSARDPGAARRGGAGREREPTPAVSADAVEPARRRGSR